jgi:hypothetical protein
MNTSIIHITHTSRHYEPRYSVTGAYDAASRTIILAYLPHISIEKLLTIIIMSSRDMNIK